METEDIVVKKGEKKTIKFLWIKEKDAARKIRIRLVGENAEVNLIGIFVGAKSHAVLFDTEVIHEAPYTKSNTYIRGVLQESSSLSNNGIVRITKGARGADGYFASKILLLDNAKGRSVPSLEINENDVKAGHASTVGRPDENTMFYLRSRGLSEDQAYKLFIAGFFTPLFKVLESSEIEKLQKAIKS